MTLIDTGAARSMMREDVWTALCHRRGQPAVAIPGLRLRALSGHEIVTLGKAGVWVKGVRCEFYIVKRLQHDALFGDDVLTALGAEISFADRTVRLAGDRYVTMGGVTMEPTMDGVYADVDYWRAQYPTVFPEGESPSGHTESLYMTIDTGNAMPINQRPYRMALSKRQWVDEELQKLLDEGVIEPSNSPWASPITLAEKGDTWRLCTDYRRLNSITRKDAYPLPLIQDIFDSLEGAAVFSVLDLRSGFRQIPMHKESIEKTAIATHRGLFQFTRMQFGLANAPANFQRMMNNILSKFIGVSAMVYIDDIVVFSKNEEDHALHLHQVFKALEEHQLVVKASKCKFALREVKLLGYIVSEEGITSDPAKVEAIAEMAPPRDIKGVRSFIGMAGYYRQLIPGFADLAHPLNMLTKKWARFHWTEECQKAWEAIRDALMSEAVLAYPQVNKPYKLMTDASKHCVGAILLQEDENGLDRPVQYISKQLSEPQQRWPVVEREAYAVIYALRKLRPYLHGAEFTIYTDHKPLKCLFQNEIKNSKIQCWAVTIAEYAAPIIYRPGKLHVKPDMLSRLHVTRPQQPAPMDPTQAATMLGPHFNEGVLEADGITIRELQEEQLQMPEYQMGLDEEEHYYVAEGLLFTMRTPPGQLEYPRLVLPKYARKRVIERAHREVGHMGIAKTLARVQEAYKWPRVNKQVMEYVRRCPACITNRDRIDRPVPTPMPLSEYPGQVMAMDICGPFSMSQQGNRYILTFIDHASGFAEAIPLRDKSAKSVYDALHQRFIPWVAPPEVLIMDNSLEFRSRLVEGYLKELGIDVRHITPYSPRSNGKLERWHRTLKDMIRKMVNARPHLWEDCLGDALLAHRTTPSDVTGFSPFFLFFGRHPPKPYFNLMNRREGEGTSQMAGRVDEVSAALKLAWRNAYVNRSYNTERLTKLANAKPVKVGDSVVVMAQDTTKLDPKWDHGFVVVRVRGSVISVVGPNGVRKQLARDKMKQVPSDVQWGDLRNRLTRAQRKTGEVERVRQQRAGGNEGQDGPRRARPGDAGGDAGGNRRRAGRDDAGTLGDARDDAGQRAWVGCQGRGNGVPPGAIQQGGPAQTGTDANPLDKHGRGSRGIKRRGQEEGGTRAKRDARDDAGVGGQGRAARREGPANTCSGGNPLDKQQQGNKEQGQGKTRGGGPRGTGGIDQSQGGSRRRPWEGVNEQRGAWTRSRDSLAKRVRQLAPEEEVASEAKRQCVEVVIAFCRS